MARDINATDIGEGILPLLTWRAPTTVSPGSNTFAMTGAFYYALPFRLKPGDTFAKIIAEITTANTAALNYRVGLYAMNRATQRPGNLILDLGSVAKASGALAVSATPVELYSGLTFTHTEPDFFLVYIQDVTASLGLRRGNAVADKDGGPLLGPAIGTGILSNLALPTGLQMAGTFGAMPATIPGTWTINTQMPFLAIAK